jgi:hypothetical protein
VAIVPYLGLPGVQKGTPGQTGEVDLGIVATTGVTTPDDLGGPFVGVSGSALAPTPYGGVGMNGGVAVDPDVKTKQFSGGIAYGVPGAGVSSQVTIGKAFAFSLADAFWIWVTSSGPIM